MQLEEALAMAGMSELHGTTVCLTTAPWASHSAGAVAGWMQERPGIISAGSWLCLASGM